MRAPWLTQAYYRNPDASEALWEGGWLHTQDIGSIDADGYLQITDRLKDVIKSGGEWVSSLELEDLIAPACRRWPRWRCSAIRHEKWGERPMALVVPRAGQAERADEAGAEGSTCSGVAAAGRISKIAVPERVLVVDGDRQDQRRQDQQARCCASATIRVEHDEDRRPPQAVEHAAGRAGAFRAGPTASATASTSTSPTAPTPRRCARCVPEPLEIDEPLVRFEVMSMPDVTGLGNYTECGQAIVVRLGEERGEYLHAMYVDSHPAIASGREVSAYPEEARRAEAATSTATRWSARSTTAACASPWRRWATSTSRWTPRPRRPRSACRPSCSS